MAGSNGGSFGGSNDDGGFSDFGSDEGGSLEETIPGVPGDDYPIFAEVPDSSFLCDGLVEGGYYADPEAECQAFHICAADGTGGLTKYSFLCPNGTIFQQQYFVCDWWFNVDCSLAESLYYLNDEVAAEREAYEPSENDNSVSVGRGNLGQESGSNGRQSGNSQGGRARGNTESKAGASRGQTRTRGQTDQQQYGGAGQRTPARGSSQRGQQQQGQAQRGQQRGQSNSGRRRGGQTPARGSLSGYLAPSGQQPAYGGGAGQQDNEITQSVAADAGYGAPGDGGNDFEGAGDFPLLTEYTRNTRELEDPLNEQEKEVMTKTA